MPVMAATRAERRSSSPRWPATPARRRTIDTSRATTVAATIAAANTSRTGTGSTTSPTASEPPAMIPKVMRIVQP